jgi:hypothetical protein
MAGFLYYLPGPTQGVHLADAQAAGLGYAFDSDSFSACGIHANGLDTNGQGVVVADPKRTEKVGLYPDKQTWRKKPGREVWVGFYTDDPPKPSDLARKNQLAGHPVTLLDGEQWLCPLIRQYGEEDGELRWSAAVPQVSTLNEDGAWTVGEIVGQYKPIWETACRWQEELEKALLGTEDDEDGLVVTFTDAHEAAAEALAVNYVLGPVECSLCGLFTASAVARVLNAIVDWDCQLEWATKKNGEASDGEPSDDGQPDTSQITDQP